MSVRLRYKLFGLSGCLYRDRFHLLNTLTMAVDDCGLRLGTVDMGTEDSGNRVVSVFRLGTVYSAIVMEWTTTEYGNLEADFILV